MPPAQHDLNLDGNLRYGDGEITNITADQMVNNVLAIQKLINNHNLIASELNKVRINYEKILLGSSNILNRLDIALMQNGINLIGTIVIAVAINLLTDSSQKDNLGYCLLAIGVVMVLGSTIFHLTISFRTRS